MNVLPKISIVIPVYNVEAYIADCLQSVMRQTYRGEIEGIIVDDCGKDKSVEIAEQLINTYNDRMRREQGSLNEPHTLNERIKFRIIRHERNRGLSAARNTGTEVATGDYIFYLDSDDYISDDCIEVLTDPLKERDYDMVLGDLEMFGNPRNITFLPQEQGPIIGNTNIFSVFYAPRMVYVMAWNKLVKRELFQKHDLSFLEGQLHEDELWTYKCSKVLQSIYVQKHVTYYYRIRENSITADYRKQVKKRMDSCYATIDYVLEHPASIEKDLYDQCAVYYWGVFLRNVFEENIDFWKEYRSLRKRFDYHPVRLSAAKKLSLRELKHQLHFALPTSLGYVYLKLKRLKNLRAKYGVEVKE